MPQAAPAHPTKKKKQIQEVWVGLRACVSDKPPSNVDLQAYIDFILSNRELVFIEHLIFSGH